MIRNNSRTEVDIAIEEEMGCRADMNIKRNRNGKFKKE